MSCWWAVRSSGGSTSHSLSCQDVSTTSRQRSNRRAVNASSEPASLYLFAYYLGSSVFRSLSGTAWTAAGWPAVVALASVLVVACGLLSLRLRRIPSLDPVRR